MTDSIPKKPNAREVLTGQQMFIVELSDTIYSSKDTTVNFKAELRNAFKVIAYDANRSYTELEWVMCPENKCPDARIYDLGKADYDELDKLIIVKKNEAIAPKSVQ